MTDAQPKLIYLDQIVLDQLSKGRQPEIKHLLLKEELQVVYSDQNLDEISRSDGRQHQFLALLTELKAKHLRSTLEENFRITDRASIEDINPAAVYAAYIQNRDESPNCDGGLGAMLGKFYGGQQDKSFEDIMRVGSEQLADLLLKIKHDIPSAPDIDGLLSNLAKQLPSMFNDLGQKLDGDSATSTKNIDQTLSLGPKVLNNLKGPDIVRQVWSHISKNIPEGAITFDAFFGIARPPWDTNTRPLTTVEKINAIYHQLNFMGYYRDNDMQKERGFRSSIGDMTHAAMAAFCRIFLTMDKRLFKKTEAAYEHLRVGTVVVYAPPATGAASSDTEQPHDKIEAI